MPGDEQKSMNKAKNHARLAIIPLSMSVQTTVTHEYEAHKIPNCSLLRL